MSKRKQAEFQGTERFLIQHCLGSGGFGVVYQVFDRERSAVVALKTLRNADAEAIYRFKQEFRCLADITHPNLVTLYELLSDGEAWFFTMELVKGIDLLQYLRETAQPIIDGPETIKCAPPDAVTDDQENRTDDQENRTDDHEEAATTMLSPASLASENTTGKIETRSVAPVTAPGELQTRSLAPATSPGELETAKFDNCGSDKIDSKPPVATAAKTQFRLDVTRLRETFRQLTAGINALHEAGKLHRDIKPSNVLVTRGGRVVILDFGIVTELTAQDRQGGADIVGTPAYMSPEQAAAQPVTEATDWYSMGVMLYEALTDKRPFTGQVADLLADKQRFEPLAPAKFVAGIPEDLARLCQQLLRRDPAKRPSGAQLLQCFSGGGFNVQETNLTAPRSLPLGQVPFVGREEYLAILMAAFNTIKTAQRPATVYIQGRSGMGKSALVRHFLEELRQRETELVVLSGRCYEQESVPYKALDSLVDALSQYLKRLPATELAELLTSEMFALARLFPVLKQVTKLIRGDSKVLEIPDSQELRRRAFTALRELLARLAAKVPLILYIDDLQWGDLDSAGLLSELLRPPSPPRFLLITTYRSEDISSSPLLTTFLPLRAQADPTIDVKEIVIKELTPAESQQLAVALLGKNDRELLNRAEKIAQESRGNPFFVDELVRYAQLSETPLPGSIDTGVRQLDAVDENDDRATENLDGREVDDSGLTRLDKVIQARVMHLPAEARRLLEVVAVAGQPLERTIAKQAAELEAEEQGALALLRANRMIRVTGSSQQESIETYHDRIRETVVANLPADSLKSHHSRLAVMLEATGQADPERLATHFYQAGNNELAVKYTIAAADKAYNALAFDRAASFYRFALELRVEKDAKTHNLQVRLADSLSNAGRSYDAAKIYLIATETAKDVEALELRQRAADMLLRSGYLEQGFAELRIITDKVGIKIAKTPLRALLSFLLHRLKIRLRGYDFKERDESAVAAEDLLRLDTFWSVSVGLSMVDATRGVELQARHVLFALNVGEPHRIARALAAEAGYNASAGGRKAAGTEQLLKLNRELSERLQDPYAIAMSAHVAGIAAGCNGQWKKTIEEFTRAETIFRQHCTGVSAELDNATYWMLVTYHFLGDFNGLFDRLPAVLKDLNDRGNLFGETNLRLRTTYLRSLTTDNIAEASADLEETIGRWSQPGFQMQHFWHLFGRLQLLLYAGDPAAAWQLLEEKWPILARSLLLRIQSFYLQAHHLRARVALALIAHKSANGSSVNGSIWKIIERDVRAIEKENMPWGNAFAKQLRAGMAAARGEMAEAMRLAAEAEASFHAVDMALYANVVRRRRGEMIADIAGREMEGSELIESADNWMIAQQIKNPRAFADMLAPGSWAKIS